MNLTENFTLHEATHSATAVAKGITNEPNAAAMRCINTTAVKMEIVRVLLGGKPLTITSWFRNDATNKAVGGSKTSDHKSGLSVDFRRHGLSGAEIGRLISRSALVYDQIIDYRNGRVHIGFGNRNRRQNLEHRNGAYKPVYF